jgi:hypothetical protein
MPFKWRSGTETVRFCEIPSIGRVRIRLLDAVTISTQVGPMIVALYAPELTFWTRAIAMKMDRSQRR